MAVGLYIPPRSPITTDHYNDLQVQIDQANSRQFLIFSEQITGNGISTQFQLTGNVTNAVFISGGWNNANIQTALPVEITTLEGKPLYDASLLYMFTRHRIEAISITGSGMVNTDYAPRVGEVGNIWYWYNLSNQDRIDHYYRSDFVAKMEETSGDLATNIAANTQNFNNILSASDDTVQKALNTIDSLTILKSEVSNISGYLNTQINSISGIGSSNTLKIAELDTRFVNISGDTMTGQLAMSGAGIQLDTTIANPTYQEGKLFYDNAEHTLAYYNDSPNITVNLGQEILIRIKNDEGTTLVDGDVVFIYGANGNNLLARKANASSASTSRATIGVMTETVLHNGFGYCTTLGKVHGLNTNSFNEGDTVYLSDTVSGAFVSYVPTAPSRVVRIGYIVKKSSGDGHLQVHITDGLSVDEINDIKITSLSGGDLLQYNSATQLYENKPISIINSAYTPLSTTAQISAGLLDTSLNKKSTTLVYTTNVLTSLSNVYGAKAFNYNGSGQLTSISGSGQFKTKSFTYDIDGNLTTITIV